MVLIARVTSRNEVESPLSRSDGDLYRNEEVQLSSRAHTNKDRSTWGARSMKGNEHDRECRWREINMWGHLTLWRKVTFSKVKWGTMERADSQRTLFDDWPSNSKLCFHIVNNLDNVSLFSDQQWEVGVAWLHPCWSLWLHIFNRPVRHFWLLLCFVLFFFFFWRVGQQWL